MSLQAIGMATDMDASSCKISGTRKSARVAKWHAKQQQQRQQHLSLVDVRKSPVSVLQDRGCLSDDSVSGESATQNENPCNSCPISVLKLGAKRNRSRRSPAAHHAHSQADFQNSGVAEACSPPASDLKHVECSPGKCRNVLPDEDEQMLDRLMALAKVAALRLDWEFPGHGSATGLRPCWPCWQFSFPRRKVATRRRARADFEDMHIIMESARVASFSKRARSQALPFRYCDFVM